MVSGGWDGQMVICNLGSPCQLPGNGNEWLLSQSLLLLDQTHNLE